MKKASRSLHKRLLTLALGAVLFVPSLPRPAVAQPAAVTAAPELAPLLPFLDKTWKALVNAEKGLHDVARWELALAGQAVRITHSVNDGDYGGETFVMWDRNQEVLRYFYFTTAGFYTQGTMIEKDGRLVSRETVTGNENGITEVEAVQELLADGRMRVLTRMLRNGSWEDRGEVFYSVDPEARVVLP